MSDSTSTIAGVQLAEKAPGAVLNYTLDYASDLQTGDTLSASTWSASSADITLSGSTHTTSQTNIVVSGGVAGNWYVISNLAVGSTGLTYAGAIRLYVSDPAALGAGLNLPFASVVGTLAALRRDRLFAVAQNFFPGVPIDDAYLLQKLAAATALIQRQLRVLLTPSEVIPNTATQDEIDALTTAGNTVFQEPAYDYNPDIFVGNTWGFQPLRQRPVIAVHSMQFVYPTPGNTLFQIPSEWIRLDKKYGTLNLLPIQTATMLPLNAFILSALGGGRTVPNFIEIRYRAGLENVARDWPDVLDVIQKAAVLSMVEDMFVPSSRSESVSADGLSQSGSIGLDMAKYQDVIDRKLATIQNALFGIRLAVL